MANPSLQIGNSNWAIKEDNLLGYSTAGTRFVPQPITMTRESAGTRVNSSGLVETVELLGSEEVTGFTNGTSYPFSTFTTSGNNITSAIISSSFAGAVSNSISIVNGKTYKVTFTYTKNSGDDLRVLISSSVSGAGTSISNIEQVSASGDITLFFTATSTTTGYLQMGTGSGSDSLDISITNISVKESTKNNLARVDYDGTASSLLVEPERRNLVTYSSDFTQWGNARTTDTANQTISPDGSVNATYLEQNTGETNAGSIYSGVTLIAADYSFSIFAKKKEKDFIVAYDSNANRTYFNISNGTLGNNGSGGTSKIEDYGNGWYRCSVSYAESSAASTNIAWYLGDTNGSTTVTDSGGVYIYGCQVEEGSYPTSYIPTDGGTVTRVQDQYSKTGISNLINSEEGVLFVEMAALSNDLSYRYITLSDGTNSNYVIIRYYNNSNRISAYLVNSGYVYGSTAFTISDVTSFSKVAFKWKVNDFALWIDGAERSTQSSGTTFSSGVLNSLYFSEADGSGNTFYGKVKQLQVFKTALTDSELIALTT